MTKSISFFLKNKTFFGSFLLILMMSSCSEDSPLDYVVKVDDKYLTRDQLKNVIPLSASPEDSVKLANIFIDNWIRKQVVLQQADINLSDIDKDVEEELDSYESDLVIYRFERELIRQKLDTSISNLELEEYYMENIDMFKLKDLALRVSYVRKDKDKEEPKDLIKYLKSSSKEDSLELSNLCDEPGFQCYLKDEEWIYLKDLLTEVPLTIYNAERFLKTNRFVEFDSEEHNFYLNIKEYKLKDSYSPIDLETKNIESIILNGRKIELLENMREELFQKALKNGDVEINK